MTLVVVTMAVFFKQYQGYNSDMTYQPVREKRTMNSHNELSPEVAYSGQSGPSVLLVGQGPNGEGFRVGSASWSVLESDNHSRPFDGHAL